MNCVDRYSGCSRTELTNILCIQREIQTTHLIKYEILFHEDGAMTSFISCILVDSVIWGLSGCK